MKKTMIMIVVIAFTTINICCIRSEVEERKGNENVNSTSIIPENSGMFQGQVIGSLIFNEADSSENLTNKTSLDLKLKYTDSEGNEIKQADIPPEGMTLLNNYFRAYLVFCSRSNSLEANADEKLKEDKKLNLEAQNTKNNLLNIYVNAPDGKRKISWTEAGRLNQFVAENAGKQCK